METPRIAIALVQVGQLAATVGYTVVAGEMSIEQVVRAVRVVVVVLIVLADVRKNILDKVHQALLCMGFVRC